MTTITHQLQTQVRAPSPLKIKMLFFLLVSELGPLDKLKNKLSDFCPTPPPPPYEFLVTPLRPISGRCTQMGSNLKTTVNN